MRPESSANQALLEPPGARPKLEAQQTPGQRLRERRRPEAGGTLSTNNPLKPLAYARAQESFLQN